MKTVLAITAMLLLIGCAAIKRAEREYEVLWNRTFYAVIDSVHSCPRGQCTYYYSSIPGRFYSVVYTQGWHAVGDTIRVDWDTKLNSKYYY